MFYGALFVIGMALAFPSATDPEVAASGSSHASEKFYEDAYAKPAALSKQEQEKEERYVRVAERAAEQADIKGLIRRFVEEYHLEGKRVLEVGAGRGYLQDAVADYTGLDISGTARRYFHKPFVQASATAMPFKDGEFDGIWTIWVLEHVPKPESALREMRRVVKPGGVILLAPAWFCTPWAADGYEVRPYGDFGFGGRLIKASIPFRSGLRAIPPVPIRLLRRAAASFGGGPTQFHYIRLKPNYVEYWVPDADAVNSMDPFEVMLWFTTRGDKCLNCPGGFRRLVQVPHDLVIQVRPR